MALVTLVGEEMVVLVAVAVVPLVHQLVLEVLVIIMEQLEQMVAQVAGQMFQEEMLGLILVVAVAVVRTHITTIKAETVVLEL